jgi:hypothetical protein
MPNLLRTMQSNKVVQNIEAIVIGLLFGAGEIAEASLAVEEALRAYRSEMTEEEAKHIAWMVAITLGVAAALQNGAVVYFHVMKRLNKHEKHHHHHDSDHEETPTSCPMVKKILAHTLTYLGMILQGGLSLASWRRVTQNLPLAAQLPIQFTLALGRVIGSYFLHGTHIHEHLASDHQELESTQSASTPVVSNMIGYDGKVHTVKESSCGKYPRLAGLISLYGLLWLGHAAQAYFEAYETGEYVVHETNNQDYYNSQAWLHTLCGLFFLAVGAIVGLQQALVEGQHVRDVPETWEKFGRASVPVKIATTATSLAGSLAHLLPEFAGVMLIGQFFNLPFKATLCFALASIALDFFPAVALHSPYNLKMSKKGVAALSDGWERLSTWCCPHSGYHQIEDSSYQVIEHKP